MINWRFRKLLANREITQNDLTIETAITLGVKKSTVRGVITGFKTSERIETYIAERLNAPREYLFGRSKHKTIVAGNR